MINKPEWKTVGETAEIRIGMIRIEIGYDGKNYILDSDILPLNIKMDVKDIEDAKKRAIDLTRMRIVEMLNDVFKLY